MMTHRNLVGLLLAALLVAGNSIGDTSSERDRHAEPFDSSHGLEQTMKYEVQVFASLTKQAGINVTPRQPGSARPRVVEMFPFFMELV